MAVNTSLRGNAMILKFKVGVDKEGKDIFKTQRFSKIKASAADESIFSVGMALGALLDAVSFEVLKESDYQLIGQ
ncbi:DUF1659 domain-containing protein [Clostridium polynesiense]|uniref:DUF1659 domain-containing protein n=1 Tax=Clostridium polynesiense TaxID=1325933 RepID=UPI00058ECD57|nr:DUF1659 domain-containing protein [Clostridium polynesiense]